MAVPSEGAAIANTYMSTGANAPTNVREDLSEYIWEIDPEETPFVTAAGRGTEAEQITTEWLVQELQAADANVQPEGFRYVAQPAKRPNRANNICQIMFRAVTVSNTLRASDTVGGDEWDRQILLKGKELKARPGMVVHPRQGENRRRSAENVQSAVRDIARLDGRHRHAGDRRRQQRAGARYRARWSSISSPMHCRPHTSSAAIPCSGCPRRGSSVPFPSWRRAAPATRSSHRISSRRRARRPSPSAARWIPICRISGIFNWRPTSSMPDGVFLFIAKEYVELAALPGRDMAQEDYAKTGDAADGGVLFEGTLRVKAPKAHAMVGDLS